MQVCERIIEEIAKLGSAIVYISEELAEKYFEKNIDLLYDVSMVEVDLAGHSYSRIHFLLNEKLFVYIVVFQEDGTQIGAHFFWNTDISLNQLARIRLCKNTS